MKDKIRTLISYLVKRRWYVYVLVFVAYMGLLLTFFELADEVGEKETMAFDVVVLQAIYAGTSPALDMLMVNLTRLGGVGFVAFITVALLSFFAFKKQYSRFFLTLMTMTGSTGLIIVLKDYFSRDRPSLWEQLVVETSYSFPSGHSVASSALALTIIILLWRTRYRVAALTIGTGYILLIGLSRMYLGVHYPTDVMAGWLLAALWVGFVLVTMKAVSRYYGK